LFLDCVWYKQNDSSVHEADSGADEYLETVLLRFYLVGKICLREEDAANQLQNSSEKDDLARRYLWLSHQRASRG
jgi:hypothetical protein